jgi:hypothetical protein
MADMSPPDYPDELREAHGKEITSAGEEGVIPSHERPNDLTTAYAPGFKSAAESLSHAGLRVMSARYVPDVEDLDGLRLDGQILVARPRRRFLTPSALFAIALHLLSSPSLFYESIPRTGVEPTEAAHSRSRLQRVR